MSSEIKTELHQQFVVNVSGKYIVTDFRTKINKKFGSEVKNLVYKKYVMLRDSKGVTDYRVSVDTGITKSTFTDWKTGRSNPKIDKLKILADYFGVSIEYFLENTKETVR